MPRRTGGYLQRISTNRAGRACLFYILVLLLNKQGMWSSTSRDLAVKHNQFLRSVMSTKSAVVDRLSSGLGQLVSVVSGQPPEHHGYQSVQLGDGQTQRKNLDRIQNSLESYGSVEAPRTDSALSDADLLEMSLERATFPPGKRRRSCVADETMSTVVDIPDDEKSEPEKDRKINVGGPAFQETHEAQRMIKSLRYSSSFDLGMTQPGSLATWRRTSDRAGSPVNRSDTDQQRVSDAAADISGYCSAGDCSGMATFAATADGNTQPPSTLIEDYCEMFNNDEIACKTEQLVEDSVIFHHHHHHHHHLLLLLLLLFLLLLLLILLLRRRHHHHHLAHHHHHNRHHLLHRLHLHHHHHHQQQQQQQEDCMPLLQSKQRFEILTSAAWYKSSRLARRRWSDMVVLPDTPPCSPSSEVFNTRDLRRRFRDIADATYSRETEPTQVDEIESQVRCVTVGQN